MNAPVPRQTLTVRTASYRIRRHRESRMARIARLMQQPPLRLPGEPRTPPDDAPPIVWAVFLGCTTPAKLAREMDISVPAAANRLSRACADGLLFNNGGRYQAKCLQIRTKNQQGHDR